ncbi:MAG: hypothetical protein EOP50_14245 [Sphingobacteriales bacterium]|nr:MAG: hypothetical protein EOP50_14245 [Sphingobacteriales bacterium]
MLTGNSTYTRSLVLVLLLLAGIRSQAQLAQAGESLLFSTQEQSRHGDTAAVYTIADFIIEGNKHTRELIILRELPMEQGARYSLADLMERCRQAHSRLLNTGLFQEVIVGVEHTEGDEAVVLVSVKERWYFIPKPELDVVGKSYQQWFQEGMPMGYLRYGVKIKHKNLTGLNDRLSINLLNGYQKELSLVYEGLPLDAQLRWTANMAFMMGQQRDIAYKTDYNKTLGLHGDNGFLYKYTRAQASVSFRPAIKTRHNFGIAWIDESFSDTIGKANKLYVFRNTETGLQYGLVPCNRCIFFNGKNTVYLFAFYIKKGRKLFIMSRYTCNKNIR